MKPEFWPVLRKFVPVKTNHEVGDRYECEEVSSIESEILQVWPQQAFFQFSVGAWNKLISLSNYSWYEGSVWKMLQEWYTNDNMSQHSLFPASLRPHNNEGMFVASLQPGREHVQTPLYICREDHRERATTEIWDHGTVRHLRDYELNVKVRLFSSSISVEVSCVFELRMYLFSFLHYKSTV